MNLQEVFNQTQTPIFQPIKVGTFLTNVQMHEDFILASVGYRMRCLISLEDGSRFRDPVRIDNTEPELKLTKQEDFDKIGRHVNEWTLKDGSPLLRLPERIKIKVGTKLKHRGTKCTYTLIQNSDFLQKVCLFNIDFKRFRSSFTVEVKNPQDITRPELVLLLEGYGGLGSFELID